MSSSTERPSAGDTARTAPASGDAAGEQIRSEDRPEGPVSAAIIAGGIGCLTLGFLTTAAEASESFAEKLAFSEAVGPLSGKTTVAVIVWLISWAILHFVFQKRTVEGRLALNIALVLIGLGVIGTFPTFFQAFGGE